MCLKQLEEDVLAEVLATISKSEMIELPPFPPPISESPDDPMDDSVPRAPPTAPEDEDEESGGVPPCYEGYTDFELATRRALGGIRGEPAETGAGQRQDFPKMDTRRTGTQGYAAGGMAVRPTRGAQRHPR